MSIAEFFLQFFSKKKTIIEYINENGRIEFKKKKIG